MAGTEPKTETDVPPPSTPRSTDKVSQVRTAGTDPKTETDVPPPSTPKSTDKISQAPTAGAEPKTETDAPPTSTPKQAANAPDIKTVKVSNVSMAVTKKEIWEFFTFSGEIHYIEMKSESETTQHAFVTFKDSQGAETAALLTGATIADLAVSVSPVENYQLPPEAPPLTPEETQTPNTDRTSEVAQKAEEVVSTMLAKGFVLGKDALQKAKSFDEKHQLTSNASAKVASLDRKMGLTEKMKEVDERYKVTEATKSAIAAAEQKASSAGSALMSNQYVSSGAVWVSGTFAAIASKTKEKVEKVEEEKKEALNKDGANTVKDADEPSIKDSPSTPPVKSSNENNNLPKN